MPVRDSYYRRLEGRSFSGSERDRLFARVQAGEPFVDVAAVSGCDLVGDGRSVVAADFDGDGDLDLLVRQQNVPKLQLLRNDGPNGASLEVRVAGKAMGVNATVTTLAAGRVQVQQVLLGAGFLAAPPLAVHVGLGAAARAEKVEVRFPSGAVATASDVPAGSIVEAKEGEEKAAVRPRPTGFVLGPARARDDLPFLRTPLDMQADVAGSDRGPAWLKAVATGRTVVLNFWATWCEPCKKELPELSRWAKEHPDVPVVAIAVDGAAEESARVARQLGAELPVLTLAKGEAARLGLDRAVPATYVLGKDGRLLRGFWGPVDLRALPAP